MLGEAIDMMRMLWDSDIHSFKGALFDVDHAQLYDAPEQPIAVNVGVSGPKSVALAAEHGDGIMATSPEADLITGFAEQKGASGPAYGECTLAWAATEEEALNNAHDGPRRGLHPPRQGSPPS